MHHHNAGTKKRVMSSLNAYVFSIRIHLSNVLHTSFWSVICYSNEIRLLLLIQISLPNLKTTLSPKDYPCVCLVECRQKLRMPQSSCKLWTDDKLQNTLILNHSRLLPHPHQCKKYIRAYQWILIKIGLKFYLLESRLQHCRSSMLHISTWIKPSLLFHFSDTYHNVEDSCSSCSQVCEITVYGFFEQCYP